MLGTDATASRLGAATADVDIVIDYLWSEPAVAVMAAVVTDRSDGAKPLTWIEVGSIAGSTATIPSAVLGAARLQIVGSGQGSLATSEMVADLAALAQAITDGTLTVDAHPMPLAEVERAWSDAGRTTERIVLRP